MALGFTSHCNHQNNQHAAFGTLTQAHNSDASSDNNTHSGLIVGHNIDYINQSIGYDSCEFSTSVNIDYSQYANIFVASTSETAGSVACGDFSSGGSFASCGDSGSFCGVSSGGGGMSCAAFTC